jgi:hypothetical protein
LALTHAHVARSQEKPKDVTVQNVGNAQIDPETTPLHFATLKGDMSAVRDLINKGKCMCVCVHV